jgi:deoxycytidine triphosphate deaminase
MLLTDREIRIALAEKIIRIEPAPTADAFSSSSVDLSLDHRARVFRAHIDPAIRIDPASPDYSFHAISEALTQ